MYYTDEIPIYTLIWRGNVLIFYIIHVDESCLCLRQDSLKKKNSKCGHGHEHCFNLNETCLFKRQDSMNLVYRKHIFHLKFLYNHRVYVCGISNFAQSCLFKRQIQMNLVFLETQVSFSIFGKVMAILVSGQLEKLVILCF